MGPDNVMIACVAQWESGRLKIFRLRFDSSHRHFLPQGCPKNNRRDSLLIRRVRGSSRKDPLGFPVFCGELLENYIIGILSAEEISRLSTFLLYFMEELKKDLWR